METKQKAGVTPATILLALWVLVLTGILAWMANSQSQLRQELAHQGEDLRQQLAAVDTRLDARAGELERSVTDVRDDLGTTAQKVGVTQKQLAAARAQAQKAREEAQKADEALQAQLAQQQSEVESVKGTLQGAVGDLGVQSGLIATTREELAELKRRGERDYFEFDVVKSKQFTRVGDVSIRLTKVDTKRQKYNLLLLVNDRSIEKKDKTIYEPVQFYPGGKGALVELVVFEVSKDRVAGYLAAPKELAMGR
jgi:chromosome segregation ATPase